MHGMQHVIIHECALIMGNKEKNNPVSFTEKHTGCGKRRNFVGVSKRADEYYGGLAETLIF